MTRTLVSLSLLALAACGPAAQPPPQGPTPLASATTGALEVNLFADGEVGVGLSRFTYQVKQDGKALEGATVVQRPMMNMTSMSHGCPVVNPASPTDANGEAKGAVVFSMASNATETWDLGLEVTPNGGSATALKFEKVEVKERDTKRMITSGMAKYLFTLNYEKALGTGLNDFTATLHQVGTGMGASFPAVTDATVEVVPEMPSMGHGSSGNVAPTHQGDGLYSGKTSFNMTGDWVLHVTLSRAGSSLGTADFNVKL